MMEERTKEGLTLLGNRHVKYDTDYSPDVLEFFQNKHPGNDYFVKSENNDDIPVTIHLSSKAGR